MKHFLFLFSLITSSLIANDLQWTIPDAWEKSPKQSAMRLATFVVKTDQSLEISVSRFPGAVGGELPNVNRWRRQIGLAPIKTEELEKHLEVIESEAGKAKLLDISKDDQQMLAVMLPYENHTFFFKIIGKQEGVTKQKESMIALVKSLKAK